ncbi:MAG: mandelate racemase/muconate lactonizing enzyme family protein [Actinomycetota bacterium]|nr:mandelate racemase/muconate lactonizing enzyme family protein [Actinomycetota bacterium]
MQVERVEAVAYSLPFRSPYVTSRGTLERREMVLLRLRTDEGPEGLGEAVPLSLRGGDSLAKVERLVHEAATRLVGLDLSLASDDPLGFAVATTLELGTARRLPAPARAALECALFDLVAKSSGQPLWRLLKAPDCEPVLCNATLTAGEPDVVATQARRWSDDGFRTFKLKLGAGYDDEETVAAVRDAVGPGPMIRVDLNESLKPGDAAALLRAIEPHGIELAEQPASGLRGLARVRGDTKIPIAADESVTSEADAHRAVQRKACDYATVKLSKVGGIGAARQIAALIPTYLSSALDGPLGIAAAAHAAQVLRGDGNDPGLAHGLATQRLFADSIATTECRLIDGHLHLPDGPGLGVELDDAALESHRL